MSGPRLWPPSFAGAIFDFDGTIADTADIWRRVDRIFLERRGISYDPAYARALAALGFVQGALYTIETYGLDESPEDICEEWRTLSRTLYHATVDLRPGVRDYLARLRASGIRLALATTNETATLDGMRHVNLAELFDARVYGDDDRYLKTAPDIYVAAADRLGIPCERCMVFEDLAVAVGSAQQAGCATCAVRANDESQDWDTARRLADCAIEDWRDLEPQSS